ncbi:hypothetical protein RHCRD62_100060 [Rhodococcus sp. RD6.2]|nr:hypothetical protein RHCRD62_100060 [Rhodococcus sp. RD6.2]
MPGRGHPAVRGRRHGPAHRIHQSPAHTARTRCGGRPHRWADALAEQPTGMPDRGRPVPPGAPLGPARPRRWLGPATGMGTGGGDRHAAGLNWPGWPGYPADTTHRP